MINKYNFSGFFNKLFVLLNKNIQFIFYFILATAFIIIIFQIYLFKKDSRILELSILYDQAKASVNSEDFVESMDVIAREKGIYGILASLELINKKLDNKKYSNAYEGYLKLLKENKSKKIYNSIVALHASYNLIDYISSDKIEKLLSFVDKSYVSFKGFHDEILYLLTFKDEKLERRNELLNEIMNNDSISLAIKERIRKLNEFEKYQ